MNGRQDFYLINLQAFVRGSCVVGLLFEKEEKFSMRVYYDRDADVGLSKRRLSL